MTEATLRQALAYARRGWPVFPCLPGQKIPATAHGYRDATTDPHQITAWFSHGEQNLAIATGAPGPDVLDVDQHGRAGNGFAAFARLRQAGLLDGAAAYVRTPSGGLHAYFAGSHQRNGHQPGCHVDFRSAGGYILAPPSQIGGTPYRLIQAPERQHCPPPSHQAPDIGRLAGWVARQPEGNRNAGLFWAARRVLEADPAADLDPLADAARNAGLGDPEITRTLDSARKTGQPRPAPDHQAEAVSGQ
jgi:hypothetical protein